MAKYFGTNGIRGVFDEDFTLEFIHEMTLSVGTYFEKGPILIGYDGRESSPLICKIITSSLNSIGIDLKLLKFKVFKILRNSSTMYRK